MLVTVLMSTYNGEKYLREQLDSILHQKGVDVRLIVRDDCSKDHTLSILHEYANKFPNISIESGDINLRPCKSFFKLICNNTDCDYFALSDQDDIWDEDKLISAVHMLEKVDQMKPAMYFSNLRIVDQNNKFYRNSHSQRRDLNNKYRSLTECAASGCTIVYNRKLAEIAARVKPCDFSMHDTWIYMTCAFFGNVVYDYQPHINYRQHGNNVIGTQLKKNTISRMLMIIKRMFNRNLQPRYDNAVEFLREFGTELEQNDLAKVLEIVSYKRTRKTRKKLLSDIDILPAGRLKKFQIRMLVRLGIV